MGNPSTAIDSLSFALGMNIAENIEAQNLGDVNPDFLAEGIRQHMAGNGWEPKAVQDAINGIIGRQKAAEAEGRVQSEQEQLEEIAAREEVVALPNGVLIQTLVEGNGPSPDGNDDVTVNYTGRLLDGTEFDSSEGKGPQTFSLTRMIQGWTEGMQHVKTGSSVRMWIPENLAYGDRPAPGGRIPLRSALEFEIELIAVTPVE